jgi:hypothetical protein
MTDEPVVLVLADVGDWTAAEVGKHLDAHGARWLLVDTADFPQHMDVDFRMDTGHAGWQGEIWVALEANANGMWGWLAHECNLPIGEAIAEELTKP